MNLFTFREGLDVFAEELLIKLVGLQPAGKADDWKDLIKLTLHVG